MNSGIYTVDCKRAKEMAGILMDTTSNTHLHHHNQQQQHLAEEATTKDSYRQCSTKLLDSSDRDALGIADPNSTSSHASSELNQQNEKTNGVTFATPEATAISSEPSTGERTHQQPVGYNRLPMLSSGRIFSSHSRDNNAYQLNNRSSGIKSTRVSRPTATYHDRAMQQSIHRLVSATTRFDRVTGGALTVMADIAGLYLTRIGEACRARAELTTRTEPNLFDVADAVSVELRVDWESLRQWVDEWKRDVGKTKLGDSSTNGYMNYSHPQRIASTLLSSTLVPEHSSTCNGVFSEPHLTNGMGEDRIESMIDGLDLGCLLLEDMDRATYTKGIVPSHLPPLVQTGREDEEGKEASAAEEEEVKEVEDIVAAMDIGTNNDSDEDSADLARAHMLHLTASSLSVLPHSVTSDKGLHAFFRPSTKFDPTSAPDEAFPDFDIPGDALVPAVDRIQQKLSKVDKIAPGHPLFLLGDFTKQNVLGDVEGQWQHARESTYQDIYDEAANQAMDEMYNIPIPLRQLKQVDPRCPSAEVEDGEGEKEKTKSTNVDDAPLMASGGGVGEDSSVLFSASVNDNTVIDHDNLMTSMASLGEDVLDIDMNMDIDIGEELDLEGLVNLPGAKMTDSEQIGASSDIHFGDTIMEDGDANVDRNEYEQQQQKQPYTDMDMDMDLTQPTQEIAATTAAEQPILMETTIEQEEEMEEDLPDPASLPITSGLRGSGKTHWSEEWVSKAMKQRLSKMTAQDIMPCDSLFLLDPLANCRNVIDEITRAFVNSEGGGHLHETTPLEGYGPVSKNPYTIPNSSGCPLRWVIQHIIQAKGYTGAIDSLYTGRSSLAGGISGDGIDQYVHRVTSLIRASAEEEADLVVKGALKTAKENKNSWADHKLNPTIDDLIEQLASGVSKRIPWAQNKLDIHEIESRVVNREPQRTDVRPIPILTANATPLVGTPMLSLLSPAVDRLDSSGSNIDVVDNEEEIVVTEDEPVPAPLPLPLLLPLPPSAEGEPPSISEQIQVSSNEPTPNANQVFVAGNEKQIKDPEPVSIPLPAAEEPIAPIVQTPSSRSISEEARPAFIPSPVTKEQESSTTEQLLVTGEASLPSAFEQMSASVQESISLSASTTDQVPPVTEESLSSTTDHMFYDQMPSAEQASVPPLSAADEQPQATSTSEQKDTCS